MSLFELAQKSPFELPPTSKRYLVALLAISTPVIAVLYLAKVMAPVKEGNSAEFWNNACGVSLGGADYESWSGVYQPHDSWYIYYYQGFHGQLLFRVPRAQAVASFPEVLQKIKAAARQKDAPPRVRLAAKVLERNYPAVDLSPEQFLSLIRVERLNALRNSGKSHYDYAVSEEEAFSERWVRIQHYWMNVVLESGFFGGLTLFALWPWLRKRGRWCWGVHIGSIPALVMLPFYCGYASWTFSSAGPSGGILYPWVIIWFRDFPIWTGADQWALEHVPSFLEPLSQSQGPMVSISGGHGLGPVTAIVIGAGMAVLIAAGIRFAKQRRQSTANFKQ